MSIRERILEYIDSEVYKPVSREDLLIHFGLGKKDKSAFYEVLRSLEKEGLIIRTSDNKYGSVTSEYIVVGILEGHEKGFGFIVDENSDRDDIFIPAEEMNGAMHKDRVVATIMKKSKTGRRAEGKIIKILERKNETLVGTFENSKNFGFVIPDNPKIYHDIFISKSDMMKAKNNQKVVVEITKWPRFKRNPEGRIVEILGYINEKGVDILSVIRQFDLPEKFPKEVKDYVRNTKQEVSQDEIEKRVDLREMTTFTIDGPDAKDLDDAISIEKLENGNYKLGVHIADVSHYVDRNSPLDKEAYDRGNSVYLLDRVVPMLPEELSNGICSLNKGVDRLTLSVIMEINKNGMVENHKILESVINSKARLNYDPISDYLENPDEEMDESIKALTKEIDLMKDLRDILYQKREQRGSINFDFPETHIELDKDGVPIDIRKIDRRIANELIEEFMLVTNETVSEEYYWMEIPFLYRTHEEPEEDRIATFAKFVHNLGYQLKGKDIHPKDFQKLTKEIKGKKGEEAVSTMLLRSLKKAKYSSESDVHFALATQYYSHFTAPIRRYPDLVIHRIIKDNINGRLTPRRQERLESLLPDIGEHTSMTERRAEEAEREVEDMKKAEYMRTRIGNEYDGVVSSLTNFGLFVQLDNTVEGLVHFSEMVDDYYSFDEENYVIEGERTKKKYSLGDEVRILVTGVDVLKGTIDFKLV